MDRLFVDTNVFLRAFVRDVSTQAEAAISLFKKAAEGKVKLETSDLVIAEIVWTLESYYELERREILAKVLAILNTRGLAVESRDLLARAALLYESLQIDFIDAYNGLWMGEHQLSKVLTFDQKHFKCIAGIEALTPE